MLPDVLKNNFLENPALSLVKSVNEINELWKRLIVTYGYPKIMLHKNMTTLTNFIPLWKTSNPEKTSDGLIRIINLIKDLMRLADKHNIKEKLCNVDGLEKMDNLLGDARLIRLLTKSSEIEVEGEEQWKMLRKSRVHQQKSLIQRTNFRETAITIFKATTTEDQIDSNKHRYNQRVHIGNAIVQKICSFCGEGE